MITMWYSHGSEQNDKCRWFLPGRPNGTGDIKLLGVCAMNFPFSKRGSSLVCVCVSNVPAVISFHTTFSKLSKHNERLLGHCSCAPQNMSQFYWAIRRIFCSNTLELHFVDYYVCHCILFSCHGPKFFLLCPKYIQTSAHE